MKRDKSPEKHREHLDRRKHVTVVALRVTALVVVAALAAVTLLLPAAPSSKTSKAFAQTEPKSSQRDKDTLVKDIVTIDEEASDIDTQLKELDSKSAHLKDEIDGTENEIASQRQRLQKKRRALSMRVRNMYVNGKTSNLELLLTSEDFSEFMERSEFLKKVNTQDSQLIDNIKQESKKLDTSLAELKLSKAEVDGLASEFRRRQKRLAQTRSEREKLLSQAAGNRVAVQEQSSRVEAKIDQLNPPDAAPARPTGKSMTMVATGYSAQEPGLDENTATGMKAQHGVVAVDPRVIPLGTRLYVQGYGYAIAGDTGSAIKGNRIDLCFDTLAEVEAYGWRTVRVDILD